MWGKNARSIVTATALLAACTGSPGSTTVADTETAAHPHEPAVQWLSTMGPPGRYRFATTFDNVVEDPFQITVDVPDGYEGFAEVAALKQGTSQTGLSTLAVGDIYADACHWDGAVVGGTSTADEVVDALVNQAGLQVTEPTWITVDGFAGTYLERTVPMGTDLSRCHQGEFRVYLDRAGGNRYLDPGQRDLLWVVDVDGVPLVIDAAFADGADLIVRHQIFEMVESIQIDQL